MTNHFHICIKQLPKEDQPFTCGLQERCSISCLMVLCDHVQTCQNCSKHWQSDCEELHCYRIRTLLSLIRSIQEYNSIHKIKGEYKDIINKILFSILELDFMNISYTGENIRNLHAFKKLSFIKDYITIENTLINKSPDGFDIQTLINHFKL